MPYLKLKKASNSTSASDVKDITAYIEEIKWSENDLDSAKAGRDLTGKMYRGKVASKRKAEIKLLPIVTSDVNGIFTFIRQEYFYCETDLLPGGTVTMEMYNSTRGAGVMIVTQTREGVQVVKHKDVSFNIIER